MQEEDLKQNNDTFNMFLRYSINDLKKEGTCYVFTMEQVERIKEIFPNVIVKENECGYTLKLRKEDRKWLY